IDIRNAVGKRRRGPRAAVVQFVGVEHVALAGQADAPRAPIPKRLHAFERQADCVRVVPVGRKGLADEAPLHAFETACAASEAQVLSDAVTSSVAQNPFGGLTGWRSRRPRVPHPSSLPRSRRELHASSITTVQDSRRPSAYSEDVTPDLTREKNAADTIFSDHSGRRARGTCDGRGAGWRLCVVFG